MELRHAIPHSHVAREQSHLHDLGHVTWRHLGRLHAASLCVASLTHSSPGCLAISPGPSPPGEAGGEHLIPVPPGKAADSCVAILAVGGAADSCVAILAVTAM